MIVDYGGSEKQQRRHLTMGLLGGWSLVIDDYFPFFLFFFFSLLFVSFWTHTTLTNMHPGREEEGCQW